MEEPSAKRQRTDEETAATDLPEDLVPPPPPPGDPEPDAVTLALSKLTSHIGNARKFPKAAGLLRQLLASGSLTAVQHGPAVFAALRAAIVDPTRADQPELRREYSKLFTAASKAKHLFSASELVELDVYGLWAVLRPQLATDDSFQFNRTVGVIKQHVAALPEASEDDDAIMTTLQARLRGDASASADQQAATPAAAPAGVDAGAPQPDAGQPSAAAAGADAAVEQAAEQRDAADSSVGAVNGDAEPSAKPASPPEQQADAGPGPHPSRGVPGPEADPFGLEQVLEQQQVHEAQQTAAAAWTPQEADCMRRAALLDCFDSMQAACGKAWAQLSTEIAVEELAQRRGRFTPAQQPRIAALHQFAKDQRLRRKRGPSAMERRRDTTAFEAARQDWGSRTVSARGTVMTGDHKTETWLG